MRARLALHKAGIACEHREVALKAKPPEMLALSPKGTVPVLQRMDGTVIDESLEVMLWALRQQDPDGWLTKDTETARALIKQNDTEFKYWLDRYKYHIRYPEQTETEYRDQALQFVGTLEPLLAAQGGAGLYDQHWTLADAAIFPFIRQFAGVDREWFDGTDYVHVVRWLAAWEQSDLFRAIMDKRQVWRAV
jgi:glutathione S-transferase